MASDTEINTPARADGASSDAARRLDRIEQGFRYKWRWTAITLLLLAGYAESVIAYTEVFGWWWLDLLVVRMFPFSDDFIYRGSDYLTMELPWLLHAWRAFWMVSLLAGVALLFLRRPFERVPARWQYTVLVVVAGMFIWANAWRVMPIMFM